LLGGLTSILNGAFTNLLSTANITGVGGSHAAGQACPILDLSLGPVDLTLLGLNVHLDNCNNGPVTVGITAERGPGNLLGNLLCGLTHALDHGVGGIDVGALVNRIIDQIFQHLP